MVRPVFVTGAGGFVGQRLLPALAAKGISVIALDRSGRLAPASGLEIIRGDLLDPVSYRDALTRCGLVIHMAAATGRATRDDHFRINLTGTEVLLEESARARIAGFLFVSSIATTFADLSNYHYAQAKAQAEERVRRSGLRSLILRPTMILGSGAPILASLEKLALLPVAVLPGNGRAVVQPIHVDDAVACLVRAIETATFSNETIAIGGADRISIERLLRQLRAARRGSTGPLVHFPLPLLQIPLSLAETAGLGRLLPITAGQLSSFRFDGIAEPNRLQPSGGTLASLPDLFDAPATETPLPQGTPQPAAELDVECRTFTRYLVGQPANDYVRQKYRDAHDSTRQLRAATGSDEVLVRFARRGPLFAKLADAHTALFTPASLLRKKLVLLLAILETCPPYYRTIDAPLGGSPAPAFVRLVGIGVLSLASLAIGSVLLIPLRLLGGRKPGVRP